MRRLRFTLFCLTMLLPLPFLEAADAPKRGGRLIFGVRGDITSFNPHFHTRSHDKYIRELMYQQLLDMSRDARPLPALAESWAISHDGAVYTFKLRRGVKFHNGKELTADDVKWSAEYALDYKANPGTGYPDLQELKAVNVKDRYTVEFVLKQGDATFLSRMGLLQSFPITPMGSLPSTNEKISGFPPGTGPFMFKEWKPAREIVFVRHKDYWQTGLPYIDELVLKVVEDDDVRFTSLRAGDLDMVERVPYVFANKALKGEFPQLTTTIAKYAGFYRFVFNVKMPPLDNVKVRHAIHYALDKQGFIDGAFWGLGVAPDQRYPKESQWYVKLPELKPDPAKARALLNEAGISPDFEFELLCEKGEEGLYQVILGQLRAAGIRARIKVVESGGYRRLQRSGEFMINIGGSDLPNDPGMILFRHFGCDEEAVKTKQRQSNRSGYCNKEVDQLLEQAKKVVDFKKRYDLYAKVARILHEEVPEIPLVFVPRIFASQNRVRGFTTDHDGRYQLVEGGFAHVWIEK